MKKGFMKKAVAAVAAICVFGSMTAFAIGKIAGITFRTDIRDEVHTYEQALELQEKWTNGKISRRNSPTGTRLRLLCR